MMFFGTLVFCVMVSATSLECVDGTERDVPVAMFPGQMACLLGLMRAATIEKQPSESVKKFDCEPVAIPENQG